MSSYHSNQPSGRDPSPCAAVMLSVIPSCVCGHAQRALRCEPHPQLSFNGEQRAGWVREHCAAYVTTYLRNAGLKRGEYAHFHFCADGCTSASHRLVTFWVTPCHGRVRSTASR